MSIDNKFNDVNDINSKRFSRRCENDDDLAIGNDPAMGMMIILGIGLLGAIAFLGVGIASNIYDNHNNQNKSSVKNYSIQSTQDGGYRK